LDPQPGQIIIDGTLGLAGHAQIIASKVGPRGKVVGIEQDPRTLKFLKSADLPAPIKIVQGNFVDIQKILNRLNIKRVNAILLDLGVSSWQIQSYEHGLSWQVEAPLDMRLNGNGESARALLVRLKEKDLANLLYRTADENRSRNIAKTIKDSIRSIGTTKELAEAIESAMPQRGKIHPATKTFMALRMAVNHELENLQKFLKIAPDVLSLPKGPLRGGGKVAVISFHSGEDRIVKNAFKEDIWHSVTKKPIVPGRDEIKQNPSSRSAKLRVAQINKI